MPFESLRFVHCADLCLDRPPVVAGPLPDQLRTIVEDATLSAFEEVVSVCLSRQVDFLLMVGNSFVERDRSVRARVALLNGLNRLAEEDIRVFVLPGRDDTPEAWQQIGALPNNVTVFYGQTGDAVAVIRDGKVIASVSAGVAAGTSIFENSPGLLPQQPAVRRRPFTIALLTCDGSTTETWLGNQLAQPGEAGDSSSETSIPPELSNCAVDYVALGGGDTRAKFPLKVGVALHPGRTQGLSASETGPHGCTLVEVGADGMLKSQFVPTAAVRFETFDIECQAEQSRDALVADMRQTLAGCRPEACDEALLVQWNVHGSGRLFDALEQVEQRRQLIAACPAAAWDERGLLSQQVIQRIPGECSSPDEPLMAEFQRLLQEDQPFSADRLGDLIRHAAELDQTWTERLDWLRKQVAEVDVIKHARRRAAAWLTGGAETTSISDARSVPEHNLRKEERAA